MEDAGKQRVNTFLNRKQRVMLLQRMMPNRNRCADAAYQFSGSMQLKGSVYQESAVLPAQRPDLPVLKSHRSLLLDPSAGNPKGDEADPVGDKGMRPSVLRMRGFSGGRWNLLSLGEAVSESNGTSPSPSPMARPQTRGSVHRPPR